MSFLDQIVGRIVHCAESAVGLSPDRPSPAPAAPVPASAASAAGAAPEAAAAPAAASPAASGGGPLAAVDVGAVLAREAEAKGGDLRWQSSIVDLLKTLDLDSDLAARKRLAQELDVHAGADGSAEENTALHRAVMAALARNGGRMPEAVGA